MELIGPVAPFQGIRVSVEYFIYHMEMVYSVPLGKMGPVILHLMELIGPREHLIALQVIFLSELGMEQGL